MTERHALMTAWIRQVLGFQGCVLEPASADASLRRYWRARVGGKTYVVMDAPPVAEEIERFVNLARHLAALGLNTPRIYASEPEQGLLLLGDLGTRSYLDALDERTADRLYADALAALAVMQARAATDGLPVYDGPFLRRELELFREWLLVKHLGWELTEPDHALLRRVFDFLETKALEQPRVFVHRDYHSRNLMVTSPPSPGILDFQDAVIGPVTYDPVSLLRDCYIAWPRARVEAWALGYARRAVQSGILRMEYEEKYLTWFDLMGIQRHLKASGIFARLSIRDGKYGYLRDIPRTLAYVAEVAPDYPALAGLAEMIRDRILPQLTTDSRPLGSLRS